MSEDNEGRLRYRGFLYSFFFQAEDGIRRLYVTGVQTCALPIFTDAKADRVGRFELADQGTLFLDEIANVPLSQQAKLLRVIETGEFERLGSSRTRRVVTRIISATNANLSEEVTGGRFRQDLLFR